MGQNDLTGEISLQLGDIVVRLNRHWLGLLSGKLIDKPTHALPNRIPNGSHHLKRLTCRIIKRPVLVAFARYNRTGVTAAHGDDDIGRRKPNLSPPPRLHPGNVDPHFGHRLHGNGVHLIGWLGPPGQDRDPVAGKVSKPAGGHL